MFESVYGRTAARFPSKLSSPRAFGSGELISIQMDFRRKSFDFFILTYVPFKCNINKKISTGDLVEKSPYSIRVELRSWSC